MTTTYRISTYEGIHTVDEVMDHANAIGDYQPLSWLGMGPAFHRGFRSDGRPMGPPYKADGKGRRLYASSDDAMKDALLALADLPGEHRMIRADDLRSANPVHRLTHAIAAALSQGMAEREVRLRLMVDLNERPDDRRAYATGT